MTDIGGTTSRGVGRGGTSVTLENIDRDCRGAKDGSRTGVAREVVNLGSQPVSVDRGNYQ